MIHGEAFQLFLRWWTVEDLVKKNEHRTSNIESSKGGQVLNGKDEETDT